MLADFREQASDAGKRVILLGYKVSACGNVSGKFNVLLLE